MVWLQPSLQQPATVLAISWLIYWFQSIWQTGYINYSSMTDILRIKLHSVVDSEASLALKMKLQAYRRQLMQL